MSRMLADGIGVRANDAAIPGTTRELAKAASAGKYLDTFVRTHDRLKSAEKICVFDTIPMPKSRVHPI